MNTFKNFLVMILAALLVFVNTGLVLNIHYCEGNFESITSVFQENETCRGHNEEAHLHEKTIHACCVASSKNHKSCCSDEVLVIQNTNDKIGIDFKPFYCLVLPTIVQSSSGLIAELEFVDKHDFREYYFFESNAPPLYQLFCRYTYFG